MKTISKKSIISASVLLLVLGFTWNVQAQGVDATTTVELTDTQGHVRFNTFSSAHNWLNHYNFLNLGAVTQTMVEFVSELEAMKFLSSDPNRYLTKAQIDNLANGLGLSTISPVDPYVQRAYVNYMNPASVPSDSSGEDHESKESDSDSDHNSNNIESSGGSRSSGI